MKVIKACITEMIRDTLGKRELMRHHTGVVRLKLYYILDVIEAPISAKFRDKPSVRGVVKHYTI